MQVACAACGALNPTSHRYCTQCGAAMAPQMSRADAALSRPPAQGNVGRGAQRNVGRASRRAGVRAPLRMPAFSPPPAAREWANRLAESAAQGRERVLGAVAPAQLLISGAALVTLAQFTFLSPDFNQANPPAFGRLALIAGMLAFALGSFLFLRERGGGGAADGAPLAHSERRGDLRRWAWGAGAAFALYLAFRLFRGSTAGSDMLPWLAAIAALAVPLLPRDAMARASAALRAIRTDALIAGGIAAVFIALNARDINHWHYSYIGDEFEFWNFARNINLYGLTRPFSQDGVYGFNPVMSLAGKAAVMRVFGNDHFGATLSSVLTAAAAIPGVYLAAYLAGRGRTAAIAAASLFAFSHYLFALSHISYNNLDALLPMSYAAGFFLLGVRRNSPLWFYAAGAAAGMGFYTHLAARATMPILIVALALSPSLIGRSRAVWLGFAAAAFPAFIVNGAQALGWLFPQLAGGYSEAISGPFLDRVTENVRNLFAFHYNIHRSHYVTSSLMDSLSGGVAALGVGYALGTLREHSSRLLLVWLAALFVFAGLLSPHPHVPNTRMFLLLPPLAIAGGVVVGRYAWAAAARLVPGRASERAAWALVGALILTAFALNARQFWVASPPLTPLTNEAIATGAWRDHCESDLTATVFLAPNMHMLALRRYDPEGPEVRILLASDIEAGAPLPAPEALRCVIAAPAGAPEIRALEDDLRERYPGVEPLTVARYNGEATVYRFPN